LTLARAGFRVSVVEGSDTPGGGLRTKELTLPGFQHDVCAAVTPLALVSPFFSSLNLNRYRLNWIQPEIPLAHPLDGRETVYLYRDLRRTASGLGRDGDAYLRTFARLVQHCVDLIPDLLAPMHFPRNPILLARFGLPAVLPAGRLAKIKFTGEHARALFAGLAAHSMLPLARALSSAFSLVLGMLAHAVGWPLVAGGTERLADALIAELRLHGVELRTNEWMNASNLDLKRGPILLDLSPKGLLNLLGDELPEGYRSSLERYRYGPGVYKVDWALERPIPWLDPGCLQAGTLHLGGTLDEITDSEAQVWRGEHPGSPFVILVQPSLFDEQRAPQGKHTAWAYCHVPHGSIHSMVDPIEEQVERFAPGFRSRILARSTMNAVQLETYNPNYVGGDINVGVQDLKGHFLRPVPSLDPYRTPVEGVFLCSSATPPGGGVHGMCGFHAARSALRWIGG
jgi:phytoene dehydrogenase-like protein